MKLKKTKKDIVEAIKTYQKERKNEMFELETKVKAVASPSFVDALSMSQKNRQLVKDRMKEKEKDTKELVAQTVDRKENATPKTDAMKKMKLAEDFVVGTLKGKVSIKENVMTVLTSSRVNITKLIENARVNDIKYSISRVNEGYQFKYRFEFLEEEKDSTVLRTLGDIKKVVEAGKNVLLVTDGTFGLLFSKDKKVYFLDSSREDAISLQQYIKGQSNIQGLNDLISKTSAIEDFRIVSDKEANQILADAFDEFLDEAKQKFEGDYKLQTSPYKDLIGKHFDYSVDFDFLDIVAKTLGRIDFDSIEDDSDEQEAILDALMYYTDQWTVAQHYASTPDTLVWEDVLNEFRDDILTLINEIKK